jgi:hypothetical protein
MKAKVGFQQGAAVGIRRIDVDPEQSLPGGEPVPYLGQAERGA